MSSWQWACSCHNMLEVRLLYRQLAASAKLLEQTVAERTAELRESEARYRSLTELAADWYWEQDESGEFSKVSGPVLKMLGVRVAPLVGEAEPNPDEGWNPTERALLRANIAERRPFLDFLLHRAGADGTQQQFRVSGQPMFDQACRFVAYRGIGVEVMQAK